MLKFQIGLFLISVFCILNASPALIYGAGKEALSLTTEYGAEKSSNTSYEAQLRENKKSLCVRNGEKISNVRFFDNSYETQGTRASHAKLTKVKILKCD